MFFPVGDDNPSRRAPVVTWTLIALNVAVFVAVNVLGWGRGAGDLRDVFLRFGFDQRHPFSPRILSSMFLHAGLLHLAGNMWVLWIVGDNVEDKLGRARYLLLYLLGGMCATWAYVVTSRFAPAVGEVLGSEGPVSAVPLVGASGAIFAIMGTYLAFFPEARIHMLLWFFFFVQVVPVRAKWIIGAWVLQDLALTVLSRGPASGSVATAAHVGGALFGIAAGVFLKPRVGGGGAGDPWDVHTGFASHADESRRPGWFSRGPRVMPALPTESQLVAIEDAIVREVRAGRVDSALDLYPRYEAMAREKPLPGPVQIEIAHEFFRRGLPNEAHDAYQRYLETFPRGDDAAEACFRLGILFARAFGRPDDARTYLGRAAAEHDDPKIREFAQQELGRLGPV